jgi:hypothetical protein
MFIYLFYSAKIQRFIHVVASEITRKLSQIALSLLTTPKYLSDTVRRATGLSALGHINRSLVILVKQLLDNSDLSIVQIAKSCILSLCPISADSARSISACLPANTGRVFLKDAGHSDRITMTRELYPLRME